MKPKLCQGVQFYRSQNSKSLILYICDKYNSKLWQNEIYFAIVLHIGFSCLYLHSNTKNAVTDNFLQKLYSNFDDATVLLIKDLFVFLKKEFPDVAEKTINWKINQLKTKGILTHMSRGIYSLSKKSAFNPELSPNLKRLYNKVTKELPFINLCIWDSRWFNEFMVHQLFKYHIVVEAEKDATDSVFNVISDFNKNVFLKPDAEIFRRYIINHQEVIIVKPLISESPLQEFDGIKVPCLEKLLIDCLIDNDLFAAQQDELDNIYQSVFNKYLINMNKIRRYARRRDQLTEFDNKINSLNIKL